MEDAQAFARRLEASLDAKRDRLDRVELPKLKTNFKLFQTAYEGIYNVLFKKGVIHEDPYKYEMKISEVQVPPESPFIESEKIDAMSVRLSQFDSYLDFLNNYYQFSVDFLSMGRIKRLLSLVKYFNFTQFTDTSNQLNTRFFAEFVSTVKRGSDELSSGIIAEAVNQLDKTTRDILAALKELAGYHRERYKLEVRDIVMVGLTLEAESVIAHRDEALRAIKRKQAEMTVELPFYPELVEEILLEDYSSDGPSLREAVIKKLAVQQEVKTEKQKEKSFKVVILDGVRAIASASYSIEDSLEKLGENSTILQSRNTSFFAKLKAALRNMFSPEDKGVHYEVEILDAITGQRAIENIDFNAFIEEGGHKARSLSGLLQKNGPSWKRLETAPEDQDFKFLERTMEDIQRLVKRMTALDDFFKTAVPAEDRSRLRGIKAELLTIKGALIKANQKKHEYISQREEMEQMRRLGINSD